MIHLLSDSIRKDMRAALPCCNVVSHMNLSIPHIMCLLFDLVVPVLHSHGYEIWGPEVIGTCGCALSKRGAVELLHCNFMQSVLGVQKSTAVGCYNAGAQSVSDYGAPGSIKCVGSGTES